VQQSHFSLQYIRRDVHPQQFQAQHPCNNDTYLNF
jgi:hypothetical protein